jgi:hypothetical protein
MRRAGALCGLIVLAFASAGGAAADARVPRGFYGLNSWTSGMSPGEYRTMGRNDVGVLRFQFNWQAAEPAPGTFDWSRSDDYIGKSLQNGMKPLPFFFATPSWLSKQFARPPIHSRRTRSEWREFLKAAVERYGPGGTFFENESVPDRPVRVWQIWNEQNLHHGWEPSPNAKEYAKLLRMSARAIRSVDPGAKLMVGGMFYGGKKKTTIPSWRFLNTLYKHHGRRFFDMAAVHPFSPGLSWMRYQIKKMHRVIERRHVDTQLWVTELGWGSDRSPSPLTRGMEGQARMLKRSFRYITGHRRSLGVKRLLWFSWRDGATSASGQCQFCSSNGLRRKDLRPKPSWKKYTRFTARAG